MVSADGVLHVGSEDFNLYAIHPNGTLKWKFPTSQAVLFSSPVMDEYGVVYIASDDDNLYAIHSNGTLKWSVFAGFTSPILDADGVVYMAEGTF